MRLFSLSSSSWQKWILLLVLLSVAALWIPQISASAASDWYDKGNSFYDAGRYDEALTAYNKAIELDPNYAIAWTNKAMALGNLGRHIEALAAYNKAIELDPNYAEAWDGKATALNKLGRYDEALAAFNKGIELNPNYAFAWDGKATALNKLGRFDEALTSYNKAIELDQNYVQAWNNKGVALKNLGRFDEALAAYNIALELDPNYAIAWINKATALNNLGRFDEALTACNKALELDPNYAEAWNNKGWALYGLDRNAEALTAYNKALELDPNSAFAKTNKNIVLSKLSQGATPTSQDFGVILGGILLSILFIVVVGYLASHSRKSSKRITPEISDPAPKLQEPIRGYNWGELDITRRKGQQLTLFAKTIEHLCDNVNEQYIQGNRAESELLRLEAEREIKRLKGYEEKIQRWKQEGYETSTLESLKGQNNLDFIHSRFKDYEERLSRLEKIEMDLRDLNRYYPVEFKNPEIQKKVELFRAQLKNPMQISDIDGQYEFIKKNIEKISQVNVQRDQRIQSQIQLLRGSIEILMNIGIDISTFFTKAKSQDSAHTENDLKEMAEALYSKINNEMNLLQKEGIVVTHSSDEIRALIDDKNYAKAIIASGKKMSGSSALRETYSKAVLLKNILEPSPVIALFNTGNYEQFLDEGDEIYDLVNQCTTLTAKAEPFGPLPENIPKKFMELSKEQLLNTISALKRFIQESEEIKRARLSARGLFEKAEAFGKIPDAILTNIDKLDKQQLERTITELEKYLKTAKPDLTFSIENTQFVINQWHKTKITLTNKGNAHARDINFIFSQEFDTRWIEETNVNAQGTSDIEIGLFPKTEGNIPLEITAKYHDGHNKEYTSRNKFWIEVVDKMSKTPAPGPAPIKPKPPTQKQLPPELSDRYTESEFIGEGGFARVFKTMRNDGKYVAVKIPLSLDAKTGKSFIAEMQNWTKLSHPNIVKLYDYNILPMPYFEEELCDGSLADQDKPIESEEAALILFNICEGLKFAHVQKIIHRDLKPQNVLLKNGVPKISDWGLSRIISASTTTTATSFTPNYAAPEQINNRVKDERTDIWQLGVILYELVTGKLPFHGDSMTEIGMGIVTKDPMPPGEIKPEAKVIDAVVMKCLQKDPAKRYQSVLELQKDLAMYLRENYAELLKKSVTVKDYNRSAYYCGDLVMINLFTGDMKSAYKYLLDLVHYSKGDVKVEAQKLAEQLKYLIDHGIDEISDEFIQKAEIIVHQVSMGFRKKG